MEWLSMQRREFTPKSFIFLAKSCISLTTPSPSPSPREHNKPHIDRFGFEVRRAPNMAAMASSRSVFLERWDALGESAVQQKQQTRGVVVVRCDGRRGDNWVGVVVVSRRLAACAVVAMGALVAPMARALLEADEDESLLEKVKEDKKRRIQKRTTAINQFVKESEFVQVAVYKLSEAGQAIDGGDYSKATAVLAQQNADWIRDMQAALSKVSSNPDEKAAADNFRTALSSLQAAVKSGDSISSRTAFIASAEALDRWTRLTGLSEKVVGL